MQAKRTSRAQKICTQDISIMMVRSQNWTLLGRACLTTREYST
jgi:hypothetical protein